MSLVRGRDFSALLQKVKIKIQNDVIVHQSASLSDNEDVRIDFNQSNQCFNALKRQKCAIKIKKFGAPPPPCVRERQLTHLLFSQLFDLFRLFFQLVFRLSVNEDVGINFRQSNRSFNTLKH